MCSRRTSPDSAPSELWRVALGCTLPTSAVSLVSSMAEGSSWTRGSAGAAGGAAQPATTAARSPHLMTRRSAPLDGFAAFCSARNRACLMIGILGFVVPRGSPRPAADGAPAPSRRCWMESGDRSRSRYPTLVPRLSPCQAPRLAAERLAVDEGHESDESDESHEGHESPASYGSTPTGASARPRARFASSR